MKTLRIAITVIAVALLACCPGRSAAQTPDRLTVGGRAGLSCKNDAMTAAAFLQYRVSDLVRLSPSIGFVGRHQGLDAFVADLDVHFPMEFGSDRMSLYPIVGLDYASWGLHGRDAEGLKLSSSVSRLGVNAGCGFEYYASPEIKLNCEIKYTVTTRYSNTAVTLGVGYMF